MSSALEPARPFAAVVYQPFKTDVATLRREIERAEHDAGWAPTRWYETEQEDAGVGATQRAVADGAAVILGAGGDGTIRALAEALRGTGVPLALIPQGTGNLLARNIGMPLDDFSTAVRAAFSGRDQPIDLGLITIVRDDESEDEHVFLVLAGMGLDARTISATRSTLKKRFGWLAYVDAGLRTMLKDRPLDIHYSVDRSVVRPRRVYTVMVGNCGLMPGGVLLIPDAKLDDGVLDVVALRPLGPFSWLRIWRKIAVDNRVPRKTRFGRWIVNMGSGDRSVTYLQAKRFGLSVAHPEPIQLDGDDFGLAIAANGSVDPGALVLRVDPSWTPPLTAR